MTRRAARRRARQLREAEKRLRRQIENTPRVDTEVYLHGELAGLLGQARVDDLLEEYGLPPSRQGAA